MGLAPMEKVLTGVSPGLRSEMAMLLLLSDTGTLSTLPFQWPAGYSLDTIGFFIANLWLGDIIYAAIVSAISINQRKIF